MPEQKDEVLIYSGEHGAYWRPNSCGYTHNPTEAGRYSREYAERFLGPAYSGKNISLRPVPNIPSPDELELLRRKAAALDDVYGMLTRELARPAGTEAVAMANIRTFISEAMAAEGGDAEKERG